MAKNLLTLLGIALLVGCNLLAGPAAGQARNYLSRLPQGATSSCEAATDALALGLNLAGLGSAQVGLAASGYLGDRSSLEVTRDLEGIMKTGGYDAREYAIPLTGSLMTFFNPSGGYVLIVLDSGVFTQNKTVCFYQIS